MKKTLIHIMLHIKSRLIWIFMVSLCILNINNSVRATPQSPTSNTNLLILYSWHKDLPWQKTIETGIKRKLAENNISADIFTEYIDAGRFPLAKTKNSFYQLLKNKYADTRIDMIISEGFAAAQMMKDIKDLFPDAYKLVINSLLPKPQSEKTDLWEMKIQQDLHAAVQTMINVYNPEQIAVISDISETAGKQRLANFKSAMKKIGTSLPVIYLTGPSLGDIIDHSKNLPEKTAIFFLLYFTGDKGSRLTPYQAVEQISRTANAPIFTHWASLMGSGVVGGYLLSGEKVGGNAADIILSTIANRSGQELDTSALLEQDVFQHQFDWRQMQRWHIDKKVLPEDARIRFYSPGLYESYPLEITLFLSVSIILTAFAVTLTLQNRRRKKSETELRASEEKFSKAFNNAPILMTISALKNGRYLNVNETFSRITGYTTDMAIGSTSVEIGFISENDREKLKNELIRNGCVHEIELELKKADGSQLYCLYSGEIITIGEKQRLLSLAVDTTAHKTLGDRLQQAQKMESIGSLAGGIAHDFNNLLFPIMGMAELLLEDLPPESHEHANAREILKAGKRGAELVQQILAFSRQGKHKMIPVHVQQILKEVLKLIRPAIPSNIEITQEIQHDCGHIMADQTQIHQVIMNLITNAFHAVESKEGTISIHLKETLLPDETPDMIHMTSGKYVQLTISDNGYGIPAKLTDKIFEPYFTTKKLNKGTGLGLAVVYGIIKEHKGAITVKSEVDKGTAFHVYLPITEQQFDPDSPEKIRDLPKGHENILVVDDEVSVAKLQTQMLRRLGYTASFHTGSYDALEAFKKNADAFDLVITDMTMPHMTGDQLSKKLMEIRPDIPIIICTGYSKRMDEKKAGSLGVKGLLMKPAIKADLAKMVRSVLDETKSI